MHSMTSTTDKHVTGGSRVRSDGDDLVIDVSGLTPKQRGQVNVIIRAMLEGLLSADEATRLLAVGTPAEVAEEAARRLAAAGRG